MARSNTSGRAAVGEIAGHLMRRHTTAAVLYHHALAERLGLGPTDLKCFDLLRDRGSMSGSELASLTGLTTGAITGVVARLEQAGFLKRAPDTSDARKQVLTAGTERMDDIHALFRHLHGEIADVLSAFDATQIAGIREFLSRSADVIYREIALLRAGKMVPPVPPKARGVKGDVKGAVKSGRR